MRVVLTFLLSLAATSAFAGWVKVGADASGVYYLDPATMHEEESIRRISTLTDLKAPGAHGERSRQSLDEYDCKGRRRRILSVSEFSEPMGRGNLLASDRIGTKWYPVPSGAAGEIKFQAVCR